MNRILSLSISLFCLLQRYAVVPFTATIDTKPRMSLSREDTRLVQRQLLGSIQCRMTADGEIDEFSRGDPLMKKRMEKWIIVVDDEEAIRKANLSVFLFSHPECGELLLVVKLLS